MYININFIYKYIERYEEECKIFNMYSGPITDPHQHLWDYQYKYSHGWLQMDGHPWTGDWTMLAKNYLIEDSNY